MEVTVGQNEVGEIIATCAFYNGEIIRFRFVDFGSKPFEEWTPEEKEAGNRLNSKWEPMDGVHPTDFRFWDQIWDAMERAGLKPRFSA